MRVEPTTSSESSLACILSLHQDDAGNWYVSVEKRLNNGVEIFCTATYDSPREAIQGAVNRLKL